MSEETNGNGNGNGFRGLRGLLAGADEVVEREIRLLNPDTTYSGVSFFFADGLDSQTDAGYSQILQRSTKQKKSTLDEANKHVFKHRFIRSTGINDEDLKWAGCKDEDVSAFHANEKLFLTNNRLMWPIVRRAVVQYLDEVSPDAEGSKSGS